MGGVEGVGGAAGAASEEAGGQREVMSPWGDRRHGKARQAVSMGMRWRLALPLADRRCAHPRPSPVTGGEGAASEGEGEVRGIDWRGEQSKGGGIDGVNNPSGELLTPRLLPVPSGGAEVAGGWVWRLIAPACVALGSAPGRFAYRSLPSLSRLVILGRSGDELLGFDGCAHPPVDPSMRLLPLTQITSPFTGGGC